MKDDQLYLLTESIEKSFLAVSHKISAKVMVIWGERNLRWQKLVFALFK